MVLLCSDLPTCPCILLQFPGSVQLCATERGRAGAEGGRSRQRHGEVR